MEPSQALALRSLLEEQQIASLGTLHQGEPAVSMVPYALLPQGRGLVIHVSRLAAHTGDMLAHPAVGLLVLATPTTSVPVQALPRVSLQGEARPCLAADPGYARAKQLYLSRFPQSEEMFGFADFSLFIITVRSARFIGGFARAVSFAAEGFVSVMSGDGASGNPGSSIPATR